VSHPSPDGIADWPLWWFAQLEAALERRDNRAAAAALRKLEALGIEVRFLLPPSTIGANRQNTSGRQVARA
jgi:hypothetical protein